MLGGTISGNEASSTGPDNRSYGGGVYVSGSSGGNSSFTMLGGTISGNGASSTGSGYYISSSGGGVWSSGTFRIVNGTIYGNTESTTSLRNTASSTGSANGAALYGTAQRGTFSIPGDITSTWNSAGTLSTTDDTINVVNGN
jgi:hypothetical protein